MGFFGKKKNEVLDLSERYRRQQEKANQVRENSKEDNESSMGFFGAIAQTASDNSESSSSYMDLSESADEKRRKLSKRLIDMTEKIEEMSNQIYHLQQRIELIERKMGVGRF